MDEITYPFPNFNGATIHQLHWACDHLSLVGLELNHVGKKGPHAIKPIGLGQKSSK